MALTYPLDSSLGVVGAFPRLSGSLYGGKTQVRADVNVKVGAVYFK